MPRKLPYLTSSCAFLHVAHSRWCTASMQGADNPGGVDPSGKAEEYDLFAYTSPRNVPNLKVHRHSKFRRICNVSKCNVPDLVLGWSWACACHKFEAIKTALEAQSICREERTGSVHTKQALCATSQVECMVWLACPHSSDITLNCSGSLSSYSQDQSSVYHVPCDT